MEQVDRNPTWDEYVPQVYRMNYPAFERDWKQQVGFMGARNKDLIAGVRLVGDGPEQKAEDVGETCGIDSGDRERRALLVVQLGRAGEVHERDCGVL